MASTEWLGGGLDRAPSTDERSVTYGWINEEKSDEATTLGDSEAAYAVRHWWTVRDPSGTFHNATRTGPHRVLQQRQTSPSPVAPSAPERSAKHDALNFANFYVCAKSGNLCVSHGQIDPTRRH
jgi:hypothetical protein